MTAGGCVLFSYTARDFSSSLLIANKKNFKWIYIMRVINSNKRKNWNSSCFSQIASYYLQFHISSKIMDKRREDESLAPTFEHEMRNNIAAKAKF